MADQLVTQVSRDGKPAKVKKKNKLFSQVFCCFFSDPGPAGKKSKKGGSAGTAGGTAGDQYRGQVITGRYDDDAPLLPPQDKEDEGKICLVLDLDETLVHSSFKPIDYADFVIEVEIEGITHEVHVAKRPGVDEFMKRMGELYEICVFTASLSKYADPVLDLLDIHKVVKYRLFREGCCNHRGNYVKDMGRMGRPLERVVIIDNSPASYMFNQENAIPIESWFDDETDTELYDIIPFMEELSQVEDVMEALRMNQQVY